MNLHSLPPRPDLPISARAEDLIAAIASHQVIVVAGETGSGKSTQLPRLCLEAGRGQNGMIGCSQPRRIAARALARRVAEELEPAAGSNSLGGLVGYQVRFTDQLSERTQIKFMTDGILLAEIHRDRSLRRYDTLIIDEAHERSLNIDFLLGYLSSLIKRRPDLKLIITSATIDVDRFSKHFNDAPVIVVEGRGYPVDIEYQPEQEGEGLPGQIRRALDRLGRIDARGDVLVFLPGEREIFDVARFLRKTQLPHTEVLPLYARLPAASQERIFQTGAGRRIVLATNVAETSLTVPGIRFVIDSGLARISRYAAHSRTLRLPVEPISQAACRQRSGRCGRTAPGVCVRLFSEDDFIQRPEFTEPEIRRTSLVNVVLEMLALKLGLPEDFPFIDPPPNKLLTEAWQTLYELGAVDDQRQLTAIGRQLARLPVDAIHGRMLLEADRRGALAEVLVLVSALSISDVRERPLDQQQAADQAHQAFAVAGSDFLSVLSIWRWWQQQRSTLSRSKAQGSARAAFLSVQRLHEWMQLHKQLLTIVRSEGWAVAHMGAADPEAIHRSLLSGLLGRVGQHHEHNLYMGARGHKFQIFPGSVLAKQQPTWVMAAELVETGRSYARMVTSLQSSWLEQQGGHLLRRHVFDPHWDARSGRVMGFERLTLHGLTVVERRRVHYGPYDPKSARRLFIQHALVRGEMRASPAFVQRNQTLIDELSEHEHKRRRRDVLASDQALVAFFDERVPAAVFTTKAFLRWYEGLDAEAQAQLLFDRATLLRDEADLAGAAAYPSELQCGPERFALTYQFDPSSPQDGVTLTCPLHLLNRLEAERLEWLVPGMLEEKVIALITSLPKSKRRALLPVAEFARAAIESLTDTTVVEAAPHGSLLDGLSEALSRISGMALRRDDFQLGKLAAHFFMRIEVVDEQQRCLGASRDLAELRNQYADRARQEFMARQAEHWHQDGLQASDWPALPERVTTRGGHQAWPALLPQGDRFAVRLFDACEDAQPMHHEGVMQLVKGSLAALWKGLKKDHGISQAAQLAWTRVEDLSSLSAALRHMALRQLLSVDDAWALRDPSSVKVAVDRLRGMLTPTYQTIAGHCNEVLIAWHGIDRRLTELEVAAPSNVADMRSQLDDLLYAGVIDDISAERLAHYPRYLKAMALRLDALEQDPRRDSQRLAEVQPWWQAYLNHLANQAWYSEAVDAYRWLIEEYRVQQFAQQLGTAEKVSPKRLQAAADEAAVCMLTES